MSITASIQAPVNGLTPHKTEVNEGLEYQKILSIYNQIKAGNHPRLRLSGAPEAQPPLNRAPRIASSADAAFPAPASVVPRPKPTDHPSGVRPKAGAQGHSARNVALNHSPLPSQPVSSKAPVSELDPIFLTKSDDLVRAELQLQRQRAERVLREQLDQKRFDARHKPSCAEAKPEFDVADVLTRALAHVKPVDFDESRGTNENAPASDSFDENSFYSSKAPDSTSREEDDLHASSMPKLSVQPGENNGLAADGLVDRRSGELPQVDLTGSPYRVLARPTLPAAAAQQSQRDLGQRQEEVAAAMAPIAIDEDDDEAEYSPPEPTQSFSRPGQNRPSRDAFSDRGRYANGRPTHQWPDTRRYESPVDGDIRIVRSHIISPVAPRPSRVSPLAFAKGPPISQSRPSRPEYAQQRRVTIAESERTSPDIIASTGQPRKRRKLQSGKRPARRRVIVSPDPIIKEEPVSPPPFHNVPPLGSAKPRQTAERPAYVDVEPSGDVRYVSERQVEHSPVQVISDYESQVPHPHSVPRVLSRAGPREAPRATQDLRRVISLQNLPTRNNMDPPPYQTPTRLSRAPSYTLGDVSGQSRPSKPQAQVYERSHVRGQSPMPSPAYREVEVDSAYPMQPVASPAHRRIVVDEYGQQFYETIHPSRVTEAQTTSRRQEMDGYNERATIRNRTNRATSIFAEPHRQTRYVQEMPPPQIIYRRLSDAPKPATSDFRYVNDSARPAPADVHYISEEYHPEPRPSPRSRDSHVLDYPMRQPNYLDNNIPSRELNIGASSVRPLVRPYDEPREIVSPVPSVRPEAGEVNFLPDGQGSFRREPVPIERPLYEVRRHVEGNAYYRIGDDGRVLVDRPVDRPVDRLVDPRPAYAPRY